MTLNQKKRDGNWAKGSEDEWGGYFSLERECLMWILAWIFIDSASISAIAYARRKTDRARPCHCDLSAARKANRPSICNSYLSLVISFSLFFSFARYVGQWRIPFRRVSLNFVTLLEKKSGKRKEKRKKTVAPFIPRFINYRLFLISSLPTPIHCMRPRWESSRGLCSVFCIRRVLFAEGWEKEGKKTNEAEKKEEEKSVIHSGKRSKSGQRIVRIVLFIRLINIVLWPLFPPLTVPRLFSHSLAFLFPFRFSSHLWSNYDFGVNEHGTTSFSMFRRNK